MLKIFLRRSFIQKALSKFKIIGLIIVLTFITNMLTKTVAASSINWIEVPIRNEGKQAWDKGSLKANKNGTIRILSKLTASKKDKKDQEETISFLMDIDCSEKLFKDSYINGKPNLMATWESSDGDKLIEDVITQVCSTDIT